MRAGLLQNRVPITLPAIPGVELSGTIEEVGPNVTTFTKGQAIYSNTVGNLGNGSNTEFMLLPINTISPMPRNLSFDEAAWSRMVPGRRGPGCLSTAICSLGQRVLVQGGSGGVGMYAVQFAHLKGAYVIATTSTKNIEFVRELGADEVIDYTQTNFEEVVNGVDMVYDTVGGEVLDRSWQTLKPGGILISAVGFPSEETAKNFGVRTARVMFPKDLLSILEQVTMLIETGKVKCHIREIFSMEQAPQAHTLCETRHGRGRIILHIAD